MKIKKYFKTRKNAFLAAALTGILLYLIFELSGLLISGDGIFLHDDLWAIYPANYVLNFKAVLSGNFDNYSFSRGMGESAGFPYYCIINPFCWTFAFISDVNTASFVMAILSLMFAAYSFQRLCAKLLKRDNLFSIVFSCSYALCGYVLVFYYNIIYLVGLYMLPILTIQLTKMLKEGRIAPLSMSLAYLFAADYYVGYMNGVFLFVMTVVGSFYISSSKGDKWKGKIRFVLGRTLQLILSAVIAAVVCFVVLFPSAYGILSNKSFATKAEIFSPIFENGIGNGILSFFKSFLFWNGQDQNANYPATYFGMVVLVFCVIYFVKSKKNRICVGALFTFLLLCTFVPFFYVAIHMFDMPDMSLYRFAYYYAFLGCLCAVEGASTILRDKKYKIAGVLVCLAALVECVFAGVNIEKAQDRGDYENKTMYKAWKNEVKRLTDETQAIDKGFYRFYVDKCLYENEPQYFGYPGITQFCSIINQNVRTVNEYLGYASSSKMLYSTGSTPVTRMLYGQKYSIFNQRNEIYGDAYVEANAYTLPLVYSVDNDLRNLWFEEDNPFINQNYLLSIMTGQQIEAFRPIEADRLQYKLNNMLIEYTEGYGTSFKKEDTDLEEARIDFEVESDLPVYVRFNQFNYTFLLYSPFIIGETQMGYVDSSTMYTGAVMKMRTDTEVNRASILLLDYTVNAGGFTKLLVYEFYEDELKRAYDSLTPTQMEHVTYEKGHITGDIEIIEGREVLMTSIPYHKSWHVLIDGKEVETYAVVNDAFLAADITPGHHDIEMYYTDDIGRKSLPVSIVGIVILTMLTIYEKKKYKEIKK